MLIDLLKSESFYSLIERVRQNQPDLVLLDVMMPGISGFEVCEQLQSDPETKKIPIIFMTALSDVDDKVRGLRSGAVDYITKPFQADEVLARIEIHLQLQYLRQALAQQNETLEQKVEQRTIALTQTLEELQRSQLQLIQSEKMSALGNLVAGIAHEVNNPIGFIAGNLTEAERSLAELLQHLSLYRACAPQPTIDQHAEAIDLDYLIEDLPKMINSMKTGCNRVQTISTGLRVFSRTDPINKVPFSIHEGIESTLLILKHRLKANQTRPEIEVAVEYGELPEVNCFPNQLNQVFMNLLANAIDALEESSLGCSFEALNANPNRIYIRTSTLNDQHIKIQIADNGIGMTKEVQQRIFERLFTTKSTGKGTGLGLAIVQQIIVEKHGGTISVKSVPREGTEFTIVLPINS